MFPMDDIAAQLAIRDRFRRKLSLLKTPAERMCDMARLQEAMWATLRQSPEGYAHFLRRNFKIRAIQVRDANV
jgi:hypothetical protein